MKTKKLTAIAGTMLLAIAFVIAVISSCKKETVEPVSDSVTAGTVTTSSGSTTFDCYTNGISSTGLTAGQWYADKPHCNIMWETKYYQSNAMLTGRFNIFNMYVKFDEANPANTKIKGWVKLSTFNTGEPGRDGLWSIGNTSTPYSSTDYMKKGGCGMTYMGVGMDTTKIDSVNYTLLPKPSTDTAWFTSTSCARYGSGYIVKGSFVFRGVTKAIDMYMTNTVKSTTTSTTDGTKVDRVGLMGSFTINANTVFGVNSTSISDEVLIRIDCNVRNVKY